MRTGRPSPSISSTRQRTPAAGPSSVAAQALSTGSAAARGDTASVAQPVDAGGLADSSIITRCVSGSPVRGVRTTSSSGGGA